MNHSVKKWMLGGGAAAAGLAAMGAASIMSTRKMVDVALDRQMPKVRNLDKARDSLRGFQDHPQFLTEMDVCGRKLAAFSHETVKLRSYDGQQLVGHWFPVKDPKRIIIAMHGWRSSWNSDFGMIANFWREHRCGVLYAEQRGQGNSGGDYMTFGMMERHDCHAWVRWINRQFGEGTPVYLAGVSMGATTVLMAAGLDLPDNVRGIMADCGFTSPRDIWEHVAKNNLHVSYRLRGGVADNLCRRKIHMGSGDYSTVDALKKCRVPVLFAHGTEDHFVPVEMTYKNYQACKAPKQLLIVPGADHGMSYYLERNRYQNACVEFWRNCEKE